MHTAEPFKFGGGLRQLTSVCPWNGLSLFSSAELRQWVSLFSIGSCSVERDHSAAHCMFYLLLFTKVSTFVQRQRFLWGLCLILKRMIKSGEKVWHVLFFGVQFLYRCDSDIRFDEMRHAFCYEDGKGKASRYSFIEPFGRCQFPIRGEVCASIRFYYPQIIMDSLDLNAVITIYYRFTNSFI